jgi:glycyl-tRNA synthetase beta chain
LRRASTGSAPISLKSLLNEALKGYEGSEAAKKFTAAGADYSELVLKFFRERLEFYLRDVLGFAYDVVNAVLAAGSDDVVDAVARAEAVAKVRPSEDFEAISTSFKRMKNILRQAAEAGKWNSAQAAGDFGKIAQEGSEPAEKELASHSASVAVRVKQLRDSNDYEPALVEISRLRPVVDAFFDKVMVMAEDEKVRTRRLALLQMLVDEFTTIADFSEIVTEKTEKK